MISVYIPFFIVCSLLHVSKLMALNSNETNIYKNYHLINPMEYYGYKANVDLNLGITRNNCTKTELRELTALTINKRYPIEKWLHVYTDGSVLNPKAGIGGFGGAGVYSKFFSYYMRVGYHIKNFDAEIAGVWIALKKLLNKIKNIKNVVILIDSNATIRAIASNKIAKNPRVYECRQILRYLEQLKKSIVLQWIPSHCKIQGNCMAHSIARKATKKLEKQTINLSKLKRIQEIRVNFFKNQTVINIPSNQTRFIITVNQTNVIIATKWSKIIIPAKWSKVNITTSQIKFTINTKRITANVTINRTKTKNNTNYKILIKKENSNNVFTKSNFSKVNMFYKDGLIDRPTRK